MASTITAGNATNGLAISADNTGILQLKTGTGAGTVGLTIDASQNVTFAGTATSSTGTLYPIVSGTAVASTSGTSIDFTSIPSWVKRVTVMFNAVSTNGTSDLIVQLGDSGGVETSGYVGGLITNGAGGTAYSSGFDVFTYGSAAQAASGQLVLSLLDLATGTWVGSSICADGGGSRNVQGSGAKALSPGPLTSVRITTVAGTATFDAGSVNILYE